MNSTKSYLKTALLLIAINSTWAYAGSATIGDFVWHDANANGIQESGEEGIEGITVHLLKDGVEIDSTTTNSNGEYLFTNLDAGNYQIKVDKISTYQYFSPKDEGDDDSIDSDFDSNGLSNEITLEDGDNCNSVDAGLNCGCSSISIQKYTNGEDADEGMGPILDEGAQITWEYVIKNTGSMKLTDIEVIDDKEGVICSDITLEAGEEETCTKTGIVKEGQYENNATVKAKNPNGDTITDYDLSHYYGQKGACIGDLVWEDANKNGLQDSGENGIEGVSVELFDENGNSVKDLDGNTIHPINTNSVGEYIFCNLAEGNYTIKINPPSGYKVSPKDVGNDDTIDSDINPITFTSDIIKLEHGSLDSSWDGGLYKSSAACIAIQKYTNGEDADQGSGPYVNVGSSVTWEYVVKNTGDVKLDNVIVRDDKEGVICSNFSLNPGEEKNCTKTSTAVEGQYENNATVEAFSPNGDKVTDYDLSHYYGNKSICLGDFVWEDKNANGIQESGENGVEGAKVELLDENGQAATDVNGDIVAPFITKSDGKYSFCNLKEGKYIIKVTPPNGYYISPKDKGSDEAKDSDINPDSKLSDIINLSNTNDLTWDIGLFKSACIGNFVWLDYNGNGIQDNSSNEGGIEGAVVTLLDSNGDIAKDINGSVIAAQKTSSDGKYLFCNLKPGSYKVKILKDDPLYYVTFKNRGSDEAKDSDIDQNNYTTDLVTLNSGEVNLDVDGGYFKCGSLVGVYSVVEPGSKAPRAYGLSNLKVTIFDLNGKVVKETQTNSEGKFNVDGLLPGRYKVVLQKPEGFEFVNSKEYYITIKAGDKNNLEAKVAPSTTSSYPSRKKVKRDFLSAFTPLSILSLITIIFALVKVRD